MSAQPDESRSIVHRIVDDVEALHAMTCGWPLTALRETHLISAERALVGLQVSLVNLRAHISLGGEQ
jgi:hypothetical protein